VTPPLADHAARSRIEKDLDTTLVVEAAAGTGKTSALVRRMVSALMAGRARLGEMVAVTFTDTASGELKLRLRSEIERARRSPETPLAARALLTEALKALEEARIGTIHAFCADLLRERPVEAGVDPLFEMAPDDVARGLFDRAFDRWFEAQLASPADSVRRILRRARRGDEGPRALLRQAAWELALRRDFPAPWRREPFDRDPAIDALLEEMAILAQYAKDGPPDDYFTKSLEELRRFYLEVRSREEVHGRDYDGLEARFIEFARRWHSEWVGFQRGAGESGFDKAALVPRRDAVRAKLDELLRRAGADLAPALRDELWTVVVAYEEWKSRAGCLDFLDLLVRARDLVCGNAEVRRELQARFKLLFVDEFQDTDPLQAEILLLLAADDPHETDWRRARPLPGKLFLVGDPKQSIYRFRRADVALYEGVKRALLSGGAELVHLTVSFRSVPELQQAVNAAFAPRMRAETPSQPGYVPLSPFRASTPEQPALVALPVPMPYGDYRKIVSWRIEESLPDAVAAFVRWLVAESGWKVTESARSAERVPIRPQHVCLLFRRFRSGATDITHPYVRALEARHLPHVLIGGSSFHEREEIEALRNALLAIERPEDELMVFATLRGPFFALPDATLLAFRERYRTLHPFRPIEEELPPALVEVQSALAILRDLHRQRNHRPFADTVSRFLRATRAHAGLAIWPTGEQALANVARLLDMARRAERRGLSSFRAFVLRLLEDAEAGEASDSPLIEAGSEGVRMMTVHRAKGLEFPVVVLADLTAPETRAEPSRYVDAERRLCAVRLAGCAPPELLEHGAEELEREREEAIRLLYVATTRARDLLVVPAIGDERRDGWLAALHPAIYPSEERSRQPESRQPRGCPSFGEDTVTKRPAAVFRPARSMSPGLHRPEAGEHRVVWWDPAVLQLSVQETVGLRQQKLLEADEGGVRSEAGIRAHAAWQEVRAQVRGAGAQPSFRVTTATEEAEMGALSSEVRVERVEPGGERPHGKRFGALVHAVLAAVDLDAGADGVGEIASVQARLLGACPEESAAAVDVVVRALGHPLLRRAAAAARAGECRRETPLSIRLEDGTLVEGIVDAAFVERDPEPTWTVVDFKTDLEIGERLGAYERQVGIYAAAIARATGCKARGVLLRL
jgi:ATP-dependent exoDNAse (exonuclease V) beta subunit